MTAAPTYVNEYVSPASGRGLKYVAARFPSFLKMNGPDPMVYDENSGRWLRGKKALTPFVKYMHLAFVNTKSDYGVSKRKMDSVFSLMILLDDEDYFFENALEASKGKILFTDCIYDKLTESRLPFTPDIYFARRVPHALPDLEEKPAGVDEFEEWMFNKPFPEAGVGAYYKHELMRAVFGIGGETVMFHLGNGGSGGKSVQLRALKKAFGKLIVSLDGKHLAVDKHSSAGGASPQLMAMQDARLVLVSEFAKEAILNMALIKTVTGGDDIAARQLYGEIENFKTFCKVWFILNNLPAFSECGPEMLKRVRQLDTNVQFLPATEYNDVLSVKQKTDPNAESYEALLARDLIYKADEALTDRCISNPSALIYLLVKQPVCNLEAITPECVKVASKNTVMERDTVRNKFFEMFEPDQAGHVSTKLLQETLGEPHTAGSDKIMASRMAAWGFGRPKNIKFRGGDESGNHACFAKEGVRSGYVGVKRKRREDE